LVLFFRKEHLSCLYFQRRKKFNHDGTKDYTKFPTFVNPFLIFVPVWLYPYSLYTRLNGYQKS